MDCVIDSEACGNCDHDHLPLTRSVWYASRNDECSEPGCDCQTYREPIKTPKVYKCSDCQRMVTRVWRPNSGGRQHCDDCRQPD